MSLSETAGRQLTIQKIVSMAYKLATLTNDQQSATAAQLANAQDFLETIVDSLQAEGVFARAVAFELVALATGTSRYSMSTGVLEVIGTAAYIRESEADLEQAQFETLVSPISSEQWQMLSARSAQSIPSMYFSDRSVDPVQVVVWPIPNEDGHIRFRVHRHLKDCSQGAATLDLEVYWLQYVLWELAHQLAAAATMPVERLMYYSGQASARKRIAKSMAGQNLPSQMVVTHGGGR